MNDSSIDVAYEIARDDAFQDIAVRGITLADREFAHSVHVEVDGLEPGRPYWYRFMSGDAVSRTGRAMTAPAASAQLDRLRFGVVVLRELRGRLFLAPISILRMRIPIS